MSPRALHPGSSANRRPFRRRGSVLFLTLLLATTMLALLAFSIDVGYMSVARTELQRAADSAALAAASGLLNQTRLQGDAAQSAVLLAARNAANQYSLVNLVCGTGPALDLNTANSPSGDIVFGRYSPLTGMSTSLAPDQFNAVLVRVQKTAERNGEYPLFFARFLGVLSASGQAEAIATFRDGITGFRVTEHTQNSGLMPFALDIKDWQNLLAGAGTDTWSYNPDMRALSAGSDGVKELRLFPTKVLPSGITPGNFGTVNIGPPANSDAVLKRQISHGVSAEDLSYYGGELKLNDQGLMLLNGDTGIGADLQLALPDVLGKARTVFLYQKVENPGNNATYTVVGFAGIRVVDFDLHGNNKYVTIQQAIAVDSTAISSDLNTSYHVYQPVVLVR